MRTVWAFVATVLVLGSCVQKDWIDRTLVTADVTGTWYGTVSGASGGGNSSDEIWLVLEQNGSRVKGSFRIRPDSFESSGPIEGTVSGDAFHCRLVRGSKELDMTISGDEMSGRTGGRPVFLRRVDPSSIPTTTTR